MRRVATLWNLPRRLNSDNSDGSCSRDCDGTKEVKVNRYFLKSLAREKNTYSPGQKVVLQTNDER